MSSSEQESSDNLKCSFGEHLLSLILRSSGFKITIPSRIPGLQIVSTFDFFVLAAVSALCGAGVVMILNAEAKLAADKKYSTVLAVAFVAALVISRYAQLALFSKCTEAVEHALHQRRERIAEKILRLDCDGVQKLGRTAIVDGMARHYEVLSQTLVALIGGLQSTVLLLVTLAYLFWQSLIAGCLTLICAGLIISVYVGRQAELKAEMQGAADADASLRDMSREIADGFKELLLSSAKRDCVRQEISALSRAARDCRSRLASIFADLSATSSSTSYMLASAIVFVLPILSGSGVTDISRIVTTVLFLLGPLVSIVASAQQLSTARFALTSIEQFERQISTTSPAPNARAASLLPFVGLQLSDVRFSRRSSNVDDTFSIRDVNLDLSPGELVFITGGNGSGKTTLLRILTGLYEAQSGQIQVNGKVVSNGCLEEYRHLFATVFSDYHIFRNPYGLKDEGLTNLKKYLLDFKISEKLPEDLSDGYDPTALSTGQRKRLALALAMAEDRQILVLDEWAADQDPAFRQRFYREILPGIKSSGKAIIAVTHDERYFDVADRRYNMENGVLTRVDEP